MIRAFILFSLVYFLVSCEKVIDLNLNKVNQKYVIEAIVNAGEAEHRVRITKTLAIDEATAFPIVENAIVVINDGLGNQQTLSYEGNGFYVTTDYLALENRTYTLTVTIDGEVFTASSTIPSKVPIDSLSVESFLFGPVVFNSLVVHRLDPAGVENFYQFSLFRNGVRENGIFLQTDQFADGVEIRQPIFGGGYESGDTALVEMYCIDKEIYKYFFALSQNNGGTNGATPANPDSNFGPKVLGYFSARTKESASIVIP